MIVSPYETSVTKAHRQGKRVDPDMTNRRASKRIAKHHQVKPSA